jgi:hypothetical protein
LKKTSESHPTIELTVSTGKRDYNDLKFLYPLMRPVQVSAITDSGAQAALLGLKAMYMMGIRKEDLTPAKGILRATNGERLYMIGTVFLRLTGRNNMTGATSQTGVQAYVTDHTDNFYISQQATRKLGIVGKDFPSVQTASINNEPQTDQASCRRSKNFPAPETPPELPFEPAPDNVGKMK